MVAQKEFEKKDQVKKESAEAKNTLEAYIIDTRDKMNNDQEVAEVRLASCLRRSPQAMSVVGVGHSCRGGLSC